MAFFGHKTPFSVTMQKISNPKWNAYREKFIEYANDKLDIMQALDLSENDQINLLATGIRDSNLIAVALSGEALPHFLDRLRIITERSDALAVRGAAKSSTGI